MTSLALTGCELLPDRRIDYKQSKTVEPLEVPPDLELGEQDDALRIPAASTVLASAQQPGTARDTGPAVLPPPGDVQVLRDGDQRWLRVPGEPAAIWERVRSFWREQGFEIKSDNRAAGVMETGWVENRADIPRDPVRNVLGKVFDFAYSAPTRDQYRVRLERAPQPGYTDVYIAHRGVEEVAAGPSFQWQRRPSDPGLEAEMLARLMVYLGEDEADARSALTTRDATSAPRAELGEAADGTSALILAEPFDDAWRRTGLALERLGFSVEERDREQGVFRVRYDDPLAEQDEPGLLDKLAFWRDEEDKQPEQYRLQLRDADGRSELTVLDADGEPASADTSQRILALLADQLR